MKRIPRRLAVWRARLHFGHRASSVFALPLAVALVAMGLVGLLVLGPRPSWAQVGESWSFQGGSAHLGVGPGSVPQPPLALRAVWARATAGDGQLAMPVIAAGNGVSVGLTRVVGFDVATGAIAWRSSRARGNVFPAAVDDGTGLALYTEGNTPDTSRLVAIDPASGRVAWTLRLPEPARSQLTVSAGEAFVGLRDQFLYAIDLSRRAIGWRIRTDGTVDGAPAVAGSRVFVMAADRVKVGDRLYAIDTATRRVVWTRGTQGFSSSAGSPSIVDATVYAGFGDSTVRAFDARTGAQRWSSPVREDFSSLASPSFDRGQLILCDRFGGLYRFDAATGRRVWDFQFTSSVGWGSPLIVGGSVFLGLDDGTLAAVSVPTGRLVWRTRLRFGPIGALAPAGDRLLAPILGRRGGVAAFEHDPHGVLLNVASPTQLDVTSSLAGFGAAFIIMFVVLLALFRYLVRARPGAGDGGPLQEREPVEVTS